MDQTTVTVLSDNRALTRIAFGAEPLPGRSLEWENEVCLLAIGSSCRL